MKTYEPRPGQRIADAVATLVQMARESGQPARMKFNDIDLLAMPDADPSALVQAYSAECDRRHEAYMASPEYQESERTRLAAEEARKAARDDALTRAPESPTWRSPEQWQKWVDANTDSYGGACIAYAERWARLMEGEIRAGVALEECAERMSRLADNEGITGFMYGSAVSMLAQCWEHGEALRRWHNLKTQIGNEGERANEAGGTLNPALLTVKGDR